MKLPRRPSRLLRATLSGLIFSLGCQLGAADLAELIASARQGDTQAMIALAQAYDTGEEGAQKNPAEALKWLRQAADKEESYAQYLLGKKYLHGEGVKADRLEAKKWMTLAADAGDAMARQTIRSIDIEDAFGGETGLAQLRADAKAGKPEAQWKLGDYYEQSGLNEIRATDDESATETQPDFLTAIDLYRQSAARHYAAAETSLGRMYAMGRGVRKDEAEGLRWFKLAGEHGDVDALQLLGEGFRSGLFSAPADPVEAQKWFKLAAEKGSAAARYTLADMLLEGEGSEKNPSAAKKWLRLAQAQGGDYGPQAADRLKQIEGDEAELARYPSGFPIEQRPLYAKADAGDPTAQTALALLYLEGKAVPKDEILAVQWLRRVIDGGKNSADALHQLGLLYQRGWKGQPADEAQATLLLTQALQAGHAAAADELAALRKKTMPARLERAGVAFDLAYTKAISSAAREKAVETFSDSVRQIGYDGPLDKPEMTRIILKKLLPVMEARADEAALYTMRIDSGTMDSPTFRQMISPRLKAIVAAYADAIRIGYDKVRASPDNIDAQIELTLAWQKYIDLSGSTLALPAVINASDAAHNLLVAQNQLAPSVELARKDKIVYPLLIAAWKKASERYDALRQAHDEAELLVFASALADMEADHKGDYAFRAGYLAFDGGARITPDRALARRYFQIGADKGNAWSMERIGEFALGLYDDTAADETLALTWFRKAAEKGDAVSKKWLTILKPSLTPNEKAGGAYLMAEALKAETAKLKQARDPGSKDLQPYYVYALTLGHEMAAEEVLGRYYDLGDEPTTLDLLSPAILKGAKAGSALAQRAAGEFYLKGRGGRERSLGEGLAWLQKAADQKQDVALHELAWYRAEQTRGLDDVFAALTALDHQSYKDADAAFARAVAKGSGEALLQLGIQQKRGTGVVADPVRAIAYWKQAAEKGSTEAMRHLAMNSGDNHASLADSKHWYDRAIALGDPISKEISKVIDDFTQAIRENSHKALLPEAPVDAVVQAWFNQSREETGGSPVKIGATSPSPALAKNISEEIEKAGDFFDIAFRNSATPARQQEVVHDYAATVRKISAGTALGPKEITIAIVKKIAPLMSAHPQDAVRYALGFDDASIDRPTFESMIAPKEKLMLQAYAAALLIHRNKIIPNPADGAAWLELAQAWRHYVDLSGDAVALAYVIDAAAQAHHLIQAQAQIKKTDELTEKQGIAGDLFYTTWEEVTTKQETFLKAFDYAHFIALLEPLAELDSDTEGQDAFNLGTIYLRGWSPFIAPDQQRALSYFTKAAGRGSMKAIFELALFDLGLRGAREPDEKLALSRLKEPALKDYALAKTWIALLDPALSPADRISRALAEAEKIYTAKQKITDEDQFNAEGFLLFAAMLGNDDAVVALNERAANRSKDAITADLFDVHSLHDYTADLAPVMLRAAIAGSPTAMRIVGESYLQGQGRRRSLAEGMRWLRKAADLHDPYASYQIKWLDAEKPHGLDDVYVALTALDQKNFAEAKVAFDRALAQGSAEALYQLGEQAEQGLGVPKDSVKAQKYWTQAAEKNSTSAMQKLAMTTQDNGATDPGLVKFKAWLTRASDLGDLRASEWLKAQEPPPSADTTKAQPTVNAAPSNEKILSDPGEIGVDPGPSQKQPH